jgi:carbonic anhydrase
MASFQVGPSLSWVACFLVGCAYAAPRPAPPVKPPDALDRLMEGNRRFVDSAVARPHAEPSRRMEIATSQKPFAVVLGCADSRVPPEVIFDQGLGDLFVVRLAGNIATDEIQASIEYAVEHLGVDLVMVLGHERCGAAKAAIGGVEAPAHLPSLLKALQPAVVAAARQPGDELDWVVRENVQLVVEQLNSSEPLLQDLVHEGKLRVVGARYDLDTGMVEILQ